ncbi:hypothetical protein TNIN_472021 [Trichonephila inaurata madagascariensis]|uniref:Uncharacterized protein n=1 Tax=Trichonephila inaurata madagascariensis TaxID=2747483 RepID=A0A8X7BYC5_9ARAC|nr:hypothetical protein TNIN_472021 [Trichonephila inaurata madagascariensis]
MDLAHLYFILILDEIFGLPISMNCERLQIVNLNSENFQYCMRTFPHAIEAPPFAQEDDTTWLTCTLDKCFLEQRRQQALNYGNNQKSPEDELSTMEAKLKTLKDRQDPPSPWQVELALIKNCTPITMFPPTPLLTGLRDTFILTP